MADEQSGWIPFHPEDNPSAFLIPPADQHKDRACQFISEDVLVSDGGRVYIGHYSYYEEDGIAGGCWYLYDGYRLEGITKWMPLPRP